MYHYQMAAPLWQVLWRLAAEQWDGGRGPTQWWRREFEQPLIPLVQLGESGAGLVRASPPAEQ